MIPIFIINFNRLTSTKKMFEYLLQIEGVRPIIVDNCSTYPPLIEWYATLPKENIIRCYSNNGHMVVWELGLMSKYFPDTQYFGVTDSDLDISDVPKDFVEVLMKGLKKYLVYKAGFSLEIEDLPDTKMSKEVYNWEKQFWQRRVDDQFYNAAIDTTFAIYDRGREGRVHFLSGIRADRPYVAKHMPWYLTKELITEEEIFYYTNCKTTSHWSGLVKEIIDDSN